jgi:hypothetical protein
VPRFPLAEPWPPTKPNGNSFSTCSTYNSVIRFTEEPLYHHLRGQSAVGVHGRPLLAQQVEDARLPQEGHHFVIVGRRDQHARRLRRRRLRPGLRRRRRPIWRRWRHHRLLLLQQLVLRVEHPGRLVELVVADGAAAPARRRRRSQQGAGRDQRRPRCSCSRCRRCRSR